MAVVAAFIGLGANLGDRGAALQQALASLATLPQTQVRQVSSLYRSAPVDADGPDYLNAVAELATGLSPTALLQALQAIEVAAGRERLYRNAPRTLDLDILLYGGETITSPDLTVPHPRMGERAFVLLPLSELAPEHVTPGQLAAVAGQRIERTDTLLWPVASASS
ncbi:2-amino-4-hydroxy-6-hydroxymethyldihydropteridine diphosphokinase [Acidovorax sp.]|uniref:2-amino-4-hydroxy-6- hydroxymethyldihydropteridine diphosphokinase n=1 Tax=Acidovorax sp. TaxID=1872122 RepID=UPI002ACE99F6|nr:2-amino-4-hydroxy-6-hydroxymethyldihydropteridine diphosphokinase [Acidovorax sp.]MDZ7865569.1 2-amino-4-hydroxy-6-hydroxymethyldihydropteridine diphosphokinase [Acidovorax sp.]